MRGVPAGPSETELRTAFADGWTPEAIERAAFELAPGSRVGQAQAWAATFRRGLTANSEAIHSGPADRGGDPPGGAPCS